MLEIPTILSNSINAYFVSIVYVALLLALEIPKNRLKTAPYPETQSNLLVILILRATVTQTPHLP